MYILEIAAVIVSALLMSATSKAGLGGLGHYFDLVSLLTLLVLCVPILISSHLFKDFHKAFSLVLGKKKESSLTEIKRALEAVDLVMKIFLYGGGFIFLFACIIILRDVENIQLWGMNFATATLSLLYALTVNILLLPLKSRLKIKMMEFMQG